MASVYKTASGKWGVRWRPLAGGRQLSYTPPSGTKAAARQAVREIHAAHEQGSEWIRPRRRAERARRDPHTVERAMMAFLAAKAVTLRSKQSWKNLDNRLGLFLLYLDGDRGPDQHVSCLSAGLVRGFYLWLRSERGVSDLTANLYIRSIEQAWRWLDESDEWINIVPRARRIDLPKARPARTARAPSWAEMDAAVMAARDAGDWSYRLLMLVRCTGLRPWAQAFRLTWDLVDLETGLLTIPPELGKTWNEQAGRTIPLAPVLLEEIKGWGRREGYLVDCPGEGRNPDQSRMRKWWAAAGHDPSRLPWAPMHGFRAGVITGLAAAGVKHRIACYLTGHTPGDTHSVTYTEAIALMPRFREAVATIPELGADALNVLDLRRRRPDPMAEVVLPEPGGPIDWDVQPFGQLPDTVIARKLTRGTEYTVSQAVVWYQRTKRGIDACAANHGQVIWADVDWAALDHLSHRQVAAQLGVSPSTVGRRRQLAGWGRG